MIGIQNVNLPENAREGTEEILKRANLMDFPQKIHAQVALGFDGFIDNLISVVRHRKSPSEYEIMEKMSEWVDRINESRGSSASMERIIKRISCGGFTSNVGKALSTLCGLVQNIHLFGAFGLPTIHSIFQEQLVDNYKCKVYSVSDPDQTDAYEFTDGKIMMGTYDNINELDWNKIMKNLGRDVLIDKYDSSELWGIGYWASNPNMSDIFFQIQETILPNLSRSAKKKYILLDLADLMKKPKSQLMELSSLLERFEDHVQVMLLLNDNELMTLANIFNPVSLDPMTLTQKVQESLNVSCVLSHHPRFSVLASKKVKKIVLNAFTSNPIFTTSAGDHFSAGIGYAVLVNAPIEMFPIIGNCSTSYFVRTGKSPTPKDIIQFLSHYLEYLDKDISTII